MHPGMGKHAIGAVLVVALAAAVGAAQKNPYRNYNQEKFVDNMQTAARNYGAVTQFIGKNDYESAKAQLTRAREQLAITMQFWRDKNKSDAVAMLREALNSMDNLDVALSAEKIDPAALTAASQRVGRACGACHAVYREQDPATKAYRIKPGSVQ